MLGTFTVFEAARRSGVRRVVFASSNHATGLYPSDAVVDPMMAVRPDTFYGVAKVVVSGRPAVRGEVRARRGLWIGTFGERPTQRRHLATWASPADTAAALRARMVAPTSTSRSSTWCRRTVTGTGTSPPASGTGSSRAITPRSSRATSSGRSSDPRWAVLRSGGDRRLPATVGRRHPYYRRSRWRRPAAARSDGGATSGSIDIDGIRTAALERAAAAGLAAPRSLRSQYLGFATAKSNRLADDLELLGLSAVVSSSTARSVSPRRSSSVLDAAVAAVDGRSRPHDHGARWRPPDRARRPSRRTAQPRGAGLRTDPTTVPLRRRSRCSAAGAAGAAPPGVDHVTASLRASRGQALRRSHRTVADPAPGPRHPVLEALASMSSVAGFETMRTVAPPVGRGCEYLDGRRLGLRRRARRAPRLLAEKSLAPSVDPGAYDLVIDPTNLWLTIHESDGPRHRARPGARLRGGVRRHLVRYLRPARSPQLRLGDHARDRRPHGPLTAWRRSATTTRASSPSRSTSSATASSSATSSIGASPPQAGRPLEWVRLRHSPLIHPDPAHGERLASPAPARPDHRRSSLPASTGHLRRRRQELVDRHAALQLPVHRPALLYDRARRDHRIINPLYLFLLHLSYKIYQIIAIIIYW